MRMLNPLGAWVAVAALLGAVSVWAKEPRPQYQHGRIVIPAASAQEPIRKQFSLQAARDYLEQGAWAWTASRGCVACHTNGSYLLLRPELVEALGPPDERIRRFFVRQLQQMEKQPRERLLRGIRPTQIAYLAAGLAQWDRHLLQGRLSPETVRALRLMLLLQRPDGSQGNATCWPPHESSSYHGATVAARAVAVAPGDFEYVRRQGEQELLDRVEKLRRYLQHTRPPHDYARVLLLWTASYWPELISRRQRDELVAMVWRHQRPDGGWSLRSFAAPEQWGDGRRAARLRAEKDFGRWASDGHMTGLAVLVLRRAGVAASDPRIQKAIRWLRTHQRRSGRWWTRSLNTDRYHFITYTGTLYPVAALAACDALGEESRAR